ncbi:MAG: aldo/keto reductase [Longimicrobiales bacterium]|nr:aldo/keto reductase [Longimicrobiales bacterium]
MRQVPLGSTGMNVSELCFGTMTFGRESDEATSAAVYARCREAGMDFFDCANVYAGGDSERILGRLIAPERDRVIVTSKVYFPVGDGPRDRGYSRAAIMHQVEGSLRRLGTDYLDLYFLHRFDEHTPIEDALRALDDLVTQGKIRYPAVSNFAAWQIARALGTSERLGFATFRCVQPMYNLLKRQAEVELLPLAQAEGLAVIPYSPMAGGVLTGKYGEKDLSVEGRLKSSDLYARRYGDDANFQAARAFAALARDHGWHPAALAVAWVGRHPAVTAPIIGARNLEQLESSLAATEIELDDATYAEISALTPTPALATDREEERG